MRCFALSLVPAALVIALGIGIGSHASLAAELPLKARAPAYDWSGIYVGGHFGYGGTNARWVSKIYRAQGLATACRQTALIIAYLA